MVCTLKEFNEYRQYLTTLKLEAEKMVLREEVGKAEPWWTPVSEGWGFTCGMSGRGGG